jgi:hypothetical protein
MSDFAQSVVADQAPELSQEELLKYLSGDGNADTSGATDDSAGDNDKDEEKEKKSIEDLILSQKGDNDDDNEGDEEEKEEEKEFKNIVHYLDETHKLDLNLDQLPEDLTREQEAEVISDLFEKAITGVNHKLSEYKEIEKVLSDQEVKSFIEAKRNGKTLKDFLKEYSQTPAGKDDESAVKAQLRNIYPEMTEDEISDTVGTYKEKGLLEKMANSARNNEMEQLKAEQEREAQRAAKEYEQQLSSFKKTVSGAKSVYGIPLTDQMKSDVFAVVTEVDDKGKTFMENFLETDEGLLLAALGVTHLETLMKAATTTKTNRANKKLVDKLFTKASDLQSRNEDDTKTGEFNAELADRF